MSGAKIVSPRAELAVLRGMTHKDKRIAGTLLSSVDESYFDAAESKEIYKAIRDHMGKTGEAPPFRLVIEDPELSKNTREYFRDSQATVTTLEEAAKAVKILNRYRQVRGLYEIALSVDRTLQSTTKLELDKLLDDVSNRIASVRTSKTTANQFLHFGRNNNSKDLVHDLLHGDPSEDTIPTGIRPFDEQSGGFMRGGLVTIGATSGGGKCTTLDTNIQLSTLVLELDDGSVIEGEPEHPVLCWRSGNLTRVRLDQICEQDELELDPQIMREHLADWT